MHDAAYMQQHSNDVLQVADGDKKIITSMMMIVAVSGHRINRCSTHYYHLEADYLWVAHVA